MAPAGTRPAFFDDEDAMTTRLRDVLMPGMVHVSKLGRGLLPPRAWDVVGGRWFRVYSSMDEFTGRGDAR